MATQVLNVASSVSDIIDIYLEDIWNVNTSVHGRLRGDVASTRAYGTYVGAACDEPS